jgi:hypothetical protein
MNHFLVTDIPNGHLLQDLQIIHSWWVHLRSFRGYVTYSTTMGLSCLDIHATQFEENVEISDECLKNDHSVVENLDIWNVGGVISNFRIARFSHKDDL